MRQSENLTDLFAALSTAQGEIVGAPKDSKNPHLKAKYADLASVVSVIREPLAKNGLAYIQLVTVSEKTVSVETMLTHKTGQFIAETLDLPLLQSTPQGVGSCITYGRRYSLMSMIGVAPEEDDGTAASERGPDERERGNEREPAKRDDHAVAQQEAADAEVRAYIGECKGKWATMRSQAELAAWWKENFPGFSARFRGKEDPLWIKFKEDFSEVGAKLPAEGAKATITSGAGAPADKPKDNLPDMGKPKDDIPEFQGDGRPSEASIRMNFKAALVRCVGRDDCNDAFIKHVEPFEKGLPKPFTDELYALLQKRIEEVEK